MNFYYQKVFPFNLIYKQLYDCSNCNIPLFCNREFSFSLFSSNLNNIYSRWNSFNQIEELKTKILSITPLPHSLHIGAIYNLPVMKSNLELPEFEGIKKELIFDIDITSYSDVRNCCNGKVLCIKCWKLLYIAINIIETILIDFFGFKYINWIFSGRKGIHCWVGDYITLNFNTYHRTVLLQYIGFLTCSNSKYIRLFDLNTFYNSLFTKFYSMNIDSFTEVVIDQNLFKE